MIGKPGYALLVAEVDNCKVLKYAPDGTVLWEYNGVRPIDAWLLKNDEVLITYLPDKLTQNGAICGSD